MTQGYPNKILINITRFGALMSLFLNFLTVFFFEIIQVKNFHPRLKYNEIKVDSIKFCCKKCITFESEANGSTV